MSSNSSTAQTIILDDSGPQVGYEGPWNLVNVSIPTDLSQLVSQVPSVSPIYGTLHLLEKDTNSSDGPAFIVHQYTGNSFAAFFQGNFTDPDTVVCKLDGAEQSSSVQSGIFQCLSNSTVSEGDHQIEIIIQRNRNVSFDFLTYETLSPPQDNVDRLFKNPVTLSDASTSFNFTFQGTSMGLYTTLSGELQGSPQAKLMYTIDGKNAVNFDFQSPAGNFSNPFSIPQVILQTPTMPAGNHTFQLTLLPPGNFSFDTIVVQNSKLDQVDAVPVSVPLLTNHSGKSKTGAIVGGVIGGLVALGALFFVLIMFLRHRRRSGLVKRWRSTWNGRRDPAIGLSELPGPRG